MNQALWRKAVREAWKQLVGSALLLFAFAWLFVWLMSMIDVGVWGKILRVLPPFVQPMVGVPLADLATPTGQISFLYVHVVTILVCLSWAVGRGSAVVSGEISRATLDLVASLPVRRMELLLPPAVAAAAGSAVLAGSLWGGTVVGLATVGMLDAASPWPFVRGAVNLGLMTFAMTGVTTLLSACDRDRWRTIFLAGAFYAVSAIVKMVARMWEQGDWLKFFSLLTAFEPQQAILLEPGPGTPLLIYDTTLFVVGLICYLAAAFVFHRRDIPTAI